MTLSGLSGLPVEKPEGLTDKTFQIIRDAIVNKDVTPGSRVTESALAKQIGVSKTPVREALLRLRHIGLIESDSRGLRIVQYSRERIRRAYEFREVVEAMAARYAASRNSPADTDELVSVAHASLACARAVDRLGFRDRDREFHGLVAEHAQNPFLERAVKEAVMLTSALRQRDLDEGGDSIDCAIRHVRIAEAVVAQLPERAAELMGEHIRMVASLILGPASVETVPEEAKD